MRNPGDEIVTLDENGDTAGAGEGPVRSCILTRTRDSRDALIRLVLTPGGQVLPDLRAKAPGRGAWIGATRAELDHAMAKGRLRGALSRAFKTGDIAVPDDLSTRIAAGLERAVLDRLGLEARAGHLLTGSDRIETAARGGQLRALFHAADASADGARRLAQAWRVGSDKEGSDLKGVVLPLPRTILALALGRENVVHLGLTDRAAAARVSETLDRWLHFIGPDQDAQPCETASRGSSAPGVSGANAGRKRNEESE
ncbi:hypothetical protein SAMN05192583_1548 [Sphingomonas gellani]|uniref:YlxR domain-containing protein n=1 Tax=Sphingomonas gellani TaxID=1166340 RepID=A0A1H8CE27_9SPHN|nr:DUF448 domain-containing protein [Sphingomonas gellani]SEM92684.1 hypothetical protein SAMN05192583_1548 [Sphingomonas gellani]